MYSSNAAQLTQRNNHPTEQTIESIMQDSRTTISTPPTAPEDDGGGIPLFSKNMRHLLWFVAVNIAFLDYHTLFIHRLLPLGSPSFAVPGFIFQSF